MNRAKIYILGLVFISSLNACYDNEETVTESETNDPPKVTISTTHAIKVTNENGQEVAEYSTIFGQQTQIYTNAGLKVFEGQKINKHGEKLTIIDNRGIEYQFLLSGHQNDINYSAVSIFTNRNVQQFTADQSFLLEKNNEIQLTTVANTFHVNGSNYTGNLTAQTFVPNLAIAYHNLAVPQIRTAKNHKGQRVFLTISNTFFVDFKASGTSGVTGDISLTGDIQGLINGKTKLWYCDIDAAIWKEINFTSNNSEVKFNYQKSGFYSIAEETPGIYVSGQLLLDGDPISNMQLKIGKETNVQYLHTSAQGHWMAFLPADSRVPVEVVADCGVIKSLSIETNNTDIQNYSIDLNDLKSQFSKVQGQVKDCNGKKVSSYILNKHGNTNDYFLGRDEAVNVWIPTCNSSEITLSTSDISGVESGNRVVWTVKEELNTGTWFACARAKNPYFNLIIDGENKMYWESSTSRNTDDRMLILLQQNGGGERPLTIYAPSDGVGTKPDNQLNILLREKSFVGKSYELYCPTSTLGCGFESFEITHFDHANDGIIRGYFKGRFWVKTFEPLTAGYKNIEGEFQVKKEF